MIREWCLSHRCPSRRQLHRAAGCITLLLLDLPALDRLRSEGVQLARGSNPGRTRTTHTVCIRATELRQCSMHKPRQRSQCTDTFSRDAPSWSGTREACCAALAMAKFSTAK